jgi:K+ transporter
MLISVRFGRRVLGRNLMACCGPAGTSPLYTLNGIWPASGPVPSKEDVIGGVSAIFWAMTLLPFLKYVGYLP